MKETTFNKWFNAFILGGMSLALILATVLKFEESETGRWLLLISAFGSLMGVLSSVLSANGKIWTFIFGLVNVGIYTAMCFVGAKYGNALLHALYTLPMQFVGISQWRRRPVRDDERVSARRLSGRQRFFAGLVLVAGSLAAWVILRRFSSSDTALFDSISVVCNLIGQFLMSTAYMEQWFFWIGVNVASILMWSLSLRSDPGSSYALIYVIKYSFYLINSFNGVRIWLALSRGTNR